MLNLSFQQFSIKAKEGNLVPLYREVVADCETPVSAFLKIRKGDYPFLFESVEGGEKWGRYSFLGTNPSVIIQGGPSEVIVTRNGKVEKHPTGEDPLHFLKKILSEYQPVNVEGLPRFFGGAVGYLAYDMVRFFEPITSRHPPKATPDFFFLITDSLLIFDNVQHRIKVVSNAVIKGEDLRGVYDQAIEKIDALIACLNRPLEQNNALGATKEGNTPTSNVTRNRFKKSVLKAKEYIKAGDIFQVQISQRFSVELKTDPFMVYRALRTINPSPYMFYLQLDQNHLVGTSPEVLVRLEENRVETRPIAGTRPRGHTPEGDKALEAELLADPKERAEHVMLIDLGRNDIGRVCEYDTVQVDELMVIERYSHVMHIVSNVAGDLEKGKDAFDVLKACFPAGTVTGAPKIRAMEIIDELETESRSLYAGAVGYFSFQGNMDICITIRTIVIEGNQANVQAAAGIVADSDPDREYQETVNKAKAMLAALDLANNGLEPQGRQHAPRH
ncbi:MAG: anthranilate synthase component I [Nitrospiria bacterium]